MSSAKTRAFKVPFACPLPRYCPVCDEPATQVSKIHAFEGIPLLVTYHIKVSVPYCERHFRALRGLIYRQWAAMLLVPVFFLLGAAWESAGIKQIPDSIFFAALIAVGCISLFFASYCGYKIGRQRGIRIGTQGITKTFLVTPSNESWAEKAKKNVARYYEHHSATAIEGRQSAT